MKFKINEDYDNFVRDTNVVKYTKSRSYKENDLVGAIKSIIEVIRTAASTLEDLSTSPTLKDVVVKKMLSKSFVDNSKVADELLKIIILINKNDRYE